MKEIIRKANWFDADGNSVWKTYEIATVNDKIHFSMLSRISGTTDSTVELPIAMLGELLEAYDNAEMEQWMYNNSEVLYRANEVSHNTVF